MPFDGVMYEARATSDGQRFIWVEKRAVVHVDLMRGPGENYSDVIIRLCKIEAAKLGRRRKGAQPCLNRTATASFRLRCSLPDAETRLKRRDRRLAVDSA